MALSDFRRIEYTSRFLFEIRNLLSKIFEEASGGVKVMLDSILSNAAQASVTLENFLTCMLVSLVLGIAASLLYMYKNTYAKGFVVTLALLPAIVQVVIMLVNGNLGAGVAVMGAFSLIRFRSVAGGGREIGSVFLAMAIGLATGMGSVGIAALLVAVRRTTRWIPSLRLPACLSCRCKTAAWTW